MTLAAVNVLPEPVTPSSTWSRSPAFGLRDELGDRRRLVARREIVGDEPERLAALALLGPRRAVRNERPVAFGLGERGADLNGGHSSVMGPGRTLFQ